MWELDLSPLRVVFETSLSLSVSHSRAPQTRCFLPVLHLHAGIMSQVTKCSFKISPQWVSWERQKETIPPCVEEVEHFEMDFLISPPLQCPPSGAVLWVLDLTSLPLRHTIFL